MQDPTDPKMLILIGSWVGSFILPFLMNFRNFNYGDTFKGILATLYLGPTFVNIVTIYSI